jgi:hypothetical protein
MVFGERFEENSLNGALTTAAVAWVLITRTVAAAKIGWSGTAALAVFLGGLAIYIVVTVRYRRRHRPPPAALPSTASASACPSERLLRRLARSSLSSLVLSPDSMAAKFSASLVAHTRGCADSSRTALGAPHADTDIAVGTGIRTGTGRLPSDARGEQGPLPPRPGALKPKRGQARWPP